MISVTLGPTPRLRTPPELSRHSFSLRAMDGELELATEPVVAPYVTLRRPRIHRACVEADHTKRRCQMLHSPAGDVGGGTEPPAALEPRSGTQLAATPRPVPASEPPAFPWTSALTPVSQRLRPAPSTPPKAGRRHRVAAKRRRPQRAAAEGSPLEREAGKVLSVALENCLHADKREPPAEATPEKPRWAACNGVSCGNSRPSLETSPLNRWPNLWQPPSGSEAVTWVMSSENDEDTKPSTHSPLRERGDHSPPGTAGVWTPPRSGLEPSQSSPPSGSPPPPFLYSRWKLSPFIRTVKSKLESFAGIFLSPVRSHLTWLTPDPSAGGTTPDHSAGEGAAPACGRECEGAAPSAGSEPRLLPAPSGVNIQVKIAISQPPGSPSTPKLPGQRRSPRRRLGRSRSCPDLPARRPPLLRHLPPAGPPPPRPRRHTVGGVEPSRELSPRPPPALLCLRKEVFPACGPSSPLPDPRLAGSCSPPPQPSPGHKEHATGRHQGASPSRQGSPSGDGAQARPEAVPVNGCPGVQAGQREEQLEDPDATPKKRKLQLVIRKYQEVTTPETGAKTSDSPGGEHLGKVSRFRIRKTPVKPQTNLTPMGLPKPARLNKKEFSLEEIYTNKNYKAPTEKRSFETIFEEPVERNGLLVLTSQRRLKRAVEFQDSSLPRKRRLRQRLRQAQRSGVAGGGRGLRSAMKEPELELLLRQRLAELDALSAAEDG